MKKALLALVFPGAKVMACMPCAWGILAGVVTFVLIKRHIHNKRATAIAMTKLIDSGHPVVK